MISLRARILGSYALVAIFSLLLAGAVSFLLLLGYQGRATRARQQALVATLASDLGDATNWQEGQVSPEALKRLRSEAAALGGRFMIADADYTVLQDTGQAGNLVGRRLRQLVQARPREWRRYRTSDGKVYYLTSLPLQRPGATGTEAPQRYLVLAVAVENMQQAWRDLVALLGVASLLALAASLAVAYVLSRSITRPLAALRSATQEIARGHYDQQVPVEGGDELGELAQSFNAMAEEVRRARQTERDLLANVTHDLRTPLTSIQGFSQALVEGTVDDAASYRQAAGIIHQEAARMGRLIDDLLDLARLEADAAQLACEPLELGPWLRGLGERLAPRAQAAGLSFEVRLGEWLPTVRADPQRLEQAIVNLLDNALKYTPAGGSITLKAGHALVRRGRLVPQPAGEVVVGEGPWREGPWATIEVADTGRGIPAADVRRVFERFYRADKARTETVGSGLGLSIVRGIVLGHGGRIAVRSTVGQGTSFTVLLPAG